MRTIPSSRCFCNGPAYHDKRSLKNWGSPRARFRHDPDFLRGRFRVPVEDDSHRRSYVVTRVKGTRRRRMTRVSATGE